MRENKDELDQRQSFRCQVVESRRGCALRIGGVTTPAILLDQSAGGFSTLVQLAAEPRAGKKAVLQTDAGQFNVRLAHVASSLPPKDVLPEMVEYWTEEQPSNLQPWYRLGLARESEIVVPEKPAWSPFFDNFSFRRRNFMKANYVLFLFGVFVVLAVALLPMALNLIGVGRVAAPPMASDGKSAAQSRPFPGTHKGKISGKNDDPFTAPDAARRENQRPATDLAASSGTATSKETAAVEALRSMLRRLSGPTTLALPEVIGLLHLNPKQQAKITSIIDDTAESVRRLDAKSAAEGIPREQLAQLREELLAKSRRAAEEVLTERQRQQWQRLLSQPDEHKNPAP